MRPLCVQSEVCELRLMVAILEMPSPDWPFTEEQQDCGVACYSKLLLKMQNRLPPKFTLFGTKLLLGVTFALRFELDSQHMLRFSHMLQKRASAIADYNCLLLDWWPWLSVPQKRKLTSRSFRVVRLSNAHRPMSGMVMALSGAPRDQGYDWLALQPVRLMRPVHQAIHVLAQAVAMPEQHWWPCWVSTPEPAGMDIPWSLDQQSRADQMVPPVETVRRHGAFLLRQEISTARWSAVAGHYAGIVIGKIIAARRDHLR